MAQELRLNVSALSDPNSLMPSVTIRSLDMPSISALVDSSSSHCFVDSKYVNKHSLETYAIPPLELRLLDGSVTTMTPDQPCTTSSDHVHAFTTCSTVCTYGSRLSLFSLYHH